MEPISIDITTLHYSEALRYVAIISMKWCYKFQNETVWSSKIDSVALIKSHSSIHLHSHSMASSKSNERINLFEEINKCNELTSLFHNSKFLLIYFGKSSCCWWSNGTADNDWTKKNHSS